MLSAISFTPADRYRAGYATWDLTAGDFNGDGIEDLAVANFGARPPAGDVSVLMGKGDGTFAREVRYKADNKPHNIESADLDADGDLDLVVTNCNSGNVSVLLNKGNGSFAEAINYSTGSCQSGLAVADLDGSGQFDLAVSRWSGDLSVLLGKGDGTFAEHVVFDTGPEAAGLVVADFDADGDPDVAVGNNWFGQVSVLLNHGDGSFGAPNTFAVGDGVTSRVHSVATADIDGDGDLDLVVPWEGDRSSGGLEVFLGNGDGTFAFAAEYDAGYKPSSAILRDFDGDRIVDVVVTNRFVDTVSVLAGNGDGTFAESISFPVDRRHAFRHSVTAADFDGDGLLDLAVTNGTYGGVSVLLNTTQVEPAVPQPQPGDANMDGEVNFSDFTILASNFGREGDASHADGDFDRDRDVDFSDFLILAHHFNRPRDAGSVRAPSLPGVAVDISLADEAAGQTGADLADALESAIEDLAGAVGE